MKKIVLLLIIFSIPVILMGQTRSGGGIGYFMIGPGLMDWKALNSEFSAAYPALDNSNIEMGGGGFAVISNFIIGGEGGGYTEETVKNETYKVTTSGEFGMFKVGYMVYNRKSISLYPMIGYGGKDVYIKINEDYNINWDDVVEDPKRATKLEMSSAILDLGVGFNYFVLGGGNEKGYGGFSVGLRTGYQINFENNDWKYDNGDVYNAPDFDMSHFYVRLTIGGGGFGKY